MNVTRRLFCTVAFVLSIVIGGSSTQATGDDAWTYKQSSGELSFKGNVEGTGYSGKGEGLNKPDKEDVPNVGPIPRGEWSIGDPYDDKKKGPVVMALTPVGHDARKRTGFLIHGDNKDMNKTASNGCIILSKELRQKIAKSGVKKLLVEK